MPADPIDTARKLIAASLYNSESKEALSFYRQARALIKKHDIGQGDFFGTAPGAKAWDLDDFMRAGDKVRDVIAMAKDPEVQKTVAAVKDVADGVLNLIKRAKKR